MNKCFKNIINIIIVFVLVVTMIMPSFGFFFFYYPSKDGSGETIMVTGDSYAGYYATYESGKDYNILIYAEAAKSTKENYDMMKLAIKAAPSTVIISIGVNDCNKHVTLEDFKNRMEELVSECKSMNKRVILHTYMDYDMDAFGDAKHVHMPSDYDDILKNVAKKYSNAFYIDMSDYNSKAFLQPDLIHYNSVFYDVLYDRISTALMLF
ncbi:MAG: SGNH/GDSL hydrolase family protein [Lachnospiraceae bacterium]|nr:SGNH/GDSL hydrolase family protein [Lachnospiraceae bacterium]